MTDGAVWTDVGPRDGLQNLATPAPSEVKVRLIRGLLDAGMPRVEATSFVSPKWVPQLADAVAVLGDLGSELRSRLRVLVPNVRGLELALDHGVTNVVVTVGVTESFNQRNVNRSIADSIAGVGRMVEIAGPLGVRVDVALSVCFGCPFEGEVAPERVLALCDTLNRLGVDEIAIADTIGVATPARVALLSRRLLASDPGARIALHLHDTRGLGVANVLAGHREGVRHFEGSVGGLGGCPFAPRSTGNVCSEDAIQALHSLDVPTGVDLDSLCAVARRLGEDLGLTLPGKLHRAGVWHPETVTGAASH